MTFDVQRRHALLLQTYPDLRLYALVDGLQYTKHFGVQLAPLAGQRCALFDGTPDAPLAHAGPWLVDAQRSDPLQMEELIALEQAAPSVTWLMSSLGLGELARLLSQRLDTRLPDGRTALVRFYDPRVLVSLAEVLDGHQREEFFAHIHEWHLLHNGQRAWIGRNHAHAQ